MSGADLLIRTSNAAQRRFVRSIKMHTFDSHLAEPVVSFAFDDFPRSALTEGGRMLREAGWTGTFYTAGGFCGRRVDGVDYFSRDDLIQVDRDGHEIGCHTYTHMNL